MPSWTDFLLPHPDPSSSNPSSPRHAQPPAYTHHLSAQGYLQPPPRSRYRPQRHNSNYASYAPGLGSASSSAQSSAQDLSLSQTLSLPPGLHRTRTGTGTRTRADSSVINSASCSSFGYCASAREKGKGSWQAVASVFGASSSREEKAPGGKRDRKGKGKEKERSPPPRIGALAFEVGDETTAEESEVEDDTGMDWENVSITEAAGMLEGEEEYAGGVARRVGLAISRSLLRSRSGDDLGRGRWSGSRHGERSAGGSEGGTGSRRTYAYAAAGVGAGRGRGSRRRKEPPRIEGAEVASITDAVDQLGVDEEVGDRLESGKTPTISINGVELAGVGRSPSTRAGTRGKTDPSLSQTPPLSSPNVPSLPSCSTPSASTSLSAPAPKPAEDSPDHADINIEPGRRHRADGTRDACAIDDDTALQHPGCPSSSSSPAGGRGRAGSGSGSRESEDGQRGQRSACRGASVCDVPGHAAVNRHQTIEEGGMGVQHERGGDLKEVDRNMDDNIASVGDTAVAVDGDGDIDTVIIPSTSTPVTFFDLHLDHFPLPPTSLPVRSAARSIQREDDSEDTPVVRTRSLPLDSAPGTQPLSPNFSEHQALPVAPAQSLPSSSENLPPPNPDQSPPMGLLNLGLAMARTPMMPPAPGTDARPNHRRSIDTLSVASRASSKESKASSASKLTKPTAAAKRKSKSSGSLTSATATATAATANNAGASSLSPSASPSPLQAHFASDAFASAASSSDVKAKSQNLLVPPPMSMPIPAPPTTLLLPTLNTPTAVSPLGFDPSTYFDSFSSWSMTAATMTTSPKAAVNVLSSSTSSKPGSTAVPVKKSGKAWCLRDAVSKEEDEEADVDGDLASDSDSDSEETTQVGSRKAGKTNGSGIGTSAYTDPLVSPSLLPSVLALATLDAPQASAATKSAAVAELNPLFRPSILCPPKPKPSVEEAVSGLPATTEVNSLFRPSILASAPPATAASPSSSSSTQASTPSPAPIPAPVPTFAPVAPLFIAKKNPQKRPVSIAGSPFASMSTPSSPAQPASQSTSSASGVASLLARRFSFNSSSRPKPKSTYSSNSVNSINSRGSSPAPSPGNSRPTSPSPLRNESFERRVAEVVSMLERASVSASGKDKGKQKETAKDAAEPTPASTSAAPPSAWQRLDTARSTPSNMTPSTASASSVDTERDAFFEFGVGSGHGSGSGTGSSRVSTPGTSPGPGMIGAPSAGSSLAKRWRRWSSNNLGGGGSGDSPSRGSARPNLGTTSSTSSLKSQRHVQIQKEAKVGRSMGGEGGGVVQLQRVSGSTEATAGPAITERLGDDVELEASRTSTSTSIGAASSTMPFSAPVSLPSINTASGSSTTARKLVKPRPNVRSASVDDQPNHDENLHRVFSANDLASGSSSSSTQLKRGATTKKPKFTLGGYSYGPSSNSDGVPDSPKASSSKSAAARLAPAYGSSLNATSSSSPTSAAGGLARRDTTSFRPPLIRRDAVATPEQATRRWTLASAITDEAISDEGLLKELERVRMVGEWDRRRAKQMERERARENSSGSRRRGQGVGVDRRTRALSLDAAEVLADAEVQEEEEVVDDAERTDEEDLHTEEEDTEEVRLWEIDVGFEIWEGREGMLARERAREMERARAAERQRLDREKEDSKQDGDAASVSTGSSGHTSSSMSAEHSLSTTPETTPAFSPLTISPGLAASGSPESAANKTSASASLVKQPAPTWLAAQRALLICRELILTERRYLGLMRLLLDTHSVNPYVAMRSSASTSDIASMQQHYQGIQQQLQYRSPSAVTTYASFPASQSTNAKQTHMLVGPAPPARMLAATLPLADVTSRFLRAMEGAPSVGGVAKAFVEHEVELEEAYVAWCREVGNWFVDGATSASDATSGSSSQSASIVSKIPSPPGSSDGHTSHGHEDISASSTIRLVPIPPPSPPLPGIPPFGGAVIGHTSPPPPSSSSSSATSPLKRVAGSWRRSMTSIPSLVGGGSSSGSIYTDAHLPDRKREKEVSSPVELSPSSPTTALASGFVFIGGDRVLSPGAGPSPNAVASAPIEAPPAKPLRKLGVRDLAILPTQRVMRYVLLYRDLLAHTPTAASSRLLVERALAIATRIADACDRAQGHAAFIAPNPASSSPSSTSSPNSNTTNPKTVSAHSPVVSGATSGATASRSGSGASNSSGSSGSSWRRKSKTRSRTASLSGGAVPALTPMTPVVRAGIAQKS